MWQALNSVEGGITLAAFAMATACWAFWVKSRIDLKLIRSASEAERTKLISAKQDLLFDFDANRLTRDDRYNLAIAQMNLA